MINNNVWIEANDSPTVVIFIHGIFSSSETCWRNVTSGSFWPNLVLGDPEFVRPSVFVAGYPTDPLTGPYGVREAADELIARLGSRIGNSRPLDKERLLFVCHSQGGLVIRQMLCLHHKELIGKWVGLVLCCSPGWGSLWGNLAKFFSIVIRNRQALDLVWGSRALEELDREFRRLREEKCFNFDVCGLELIETRGFWLLPAIVSKSSATRYFSYKAIPKANHSEVVKPSDQNYLSHVYLRKFAKERGFIDAPAPVVRQDQVTGTSSPRPIQTEIQDASRDTTSKYFRKIRIFVASPGDVTQERKSLNQVVEALNRRVADHFGIVLECIDWGQVAPSMGRPQEVIFKNFPLEKWDIMIGILWLRFGTPPGATNPQSGEQFQSGTEEEFKYAYEAWKETGRPRIMFYRCLRKPDGQSSADPAQHARVDRFFKEFDAQGGNPGLYKAFVDSEDFKQFIWEHLSGLIVDEAQVGNLRSQFEPPTDSTKPAPASEITQGRVRAAQLPFRNPFIVGRPITDPSTFFGREGELTFALERLRNMQSVSLVGERRIGKTSLLHAVLHHVRESFGPHCRTVFVDLLHPNCRTLDGLVSEIRDQLGLKHGTSTLRGFAKSIETAHSNGLRPIIAIDEIEAFIQLPTEFPQEFFNTLRAIASNTQVALITASRITLREMETKGTLTSTLSNILGTKKVGHFTEHEAHEFVAMQRTGSRFENNQIQKILELGQNHPLRLQVLCWHVAQANAEARSGWDKVWQEANFEIGVFLDT